MAFSVLATMPDTIEPALLMQPDRRHDLLGQTSRGGQLIELFDGGFDRLAARGELLGTSLVTLDAPCFGQSERTNDGRQHQALSHQRDQNHREGQKQNQIAFGKCESVVGHEGNCQRSGH